MKVNPYRSWLGISIVIILICIVSTAFYMFLYIVSIENILTAISNRPNVFKATSDTMIHLIQSYSLSREYTLRNSDFSIFLILPQNNQIPELQNLSYSKLLDYRKKHTDLRLLFEKYSLGTNEVIDTLFSKVNSDYPFLALGLEYSQSVFISDVVYTRGFTFDEIVYLCKFNRENVKLMISAYEGMSDDMNQHLISKVKETQDQAIVLLTFFCISLALVFLLVLLPIIYSVEKTISSCWSFFNTFNLGDLNSS
jgi:hypothetical protein